MNAPSKTKTDHSLLSSGIFDAYVFKALALATLFISIVLTIVIFLTQSMKFLELVINSGASSGSFWFLTFLAMPRFFEIIVPLALMAAIIFIYNRMTMDSEMIAMRAVGYSPLALAQPALALGFSLMVFLWIMTMFITPVSGAHMQQMRQDIRAQFSTFLFREGVFNPLGKGLTIYLREREKDGSLRGIMIHDSRDENVLPSTIMAKRGELVGTEDGGYQVIVYEGSRQEYEPEKDILRTLNFDRYTIDLPEGNPVTKRWKEPDERTIFQLVRPNLKIQRDLDNLQEFRIEIHKRISSPLLTMTFTIIACCFLLLGPLDRKGQGWRIVCAILVAVIIQGLYLSFFNFARRSEWAIAPMYILVIGPCFFGLFILSASGENFRRKVLLFFDTLIKNFPKDGLKTS